VAEEGLRKTWSSGQDESDDLPIPTKYIVFKSRYTHYFKVPSIISLTGISVSEPPAGRVQRPLEYRAGRGRQAQEEQHGRYNYDVELHDSRERRTAASGSPAKVVLTIVTTADTVSRVRDFERHSLIASVRKPVPSLTFRVYHTRPYNRNIYILM